MKYNILDCDVNLAIFSNLDLINQMIAICYATKSTMQDVMIYSTGSIAASTVSHHASSIGCRFEWSRNAWHPHELPGIHVLFDKPHNIMQQYIA